VIGANVRFNEGVSMVKGGTIGKKNLELFHAVGKGGQGGR
jgi:hypothetical protein